MASTKQLSLCLVLIVFVAWTEASPGRALQQQSASAPAPIAGQKPPFKWGSATAAFQFEGAWNESGKGVSVWDHWTHIPDNTYMNQTADVSVDFYHLYMRDIQLMKALGQKMFRMSISWPRILPNGTGEINQAGIDHYNNVIDALVAADIEPLVTVFHWDLPQVLFDEYGGWLSPRIVDDFTEFATICFEHFGDRVKYWSTFNEMLSYVNGFGSPDQFHAENTINNAQQWTVTYNILNAHASAVEVFRQVCPNGLISSNFAIQWVVPLSQSERDAAQVQMWLDNQLGAFVDPMYTGDWPQSVKESYGDMLPQFTIEQSEKLKGSLDLIMLNYYVTRFIYANESTLAGFNATTTTSDGWSAGANIDGAIITPNGLRDLLLYVKDRYDNPEIMITENGCADPHYNDTSAAHDAIQDDVATLYYQLHLNAIKEAMEQGANVTGYVNWAWTDNYEWRGYNPRMGTIYADYFGTQKRTVKSSGWWLSKYFTTGQNMTRDEAVQYALQMQYADEPGTSPAPAPAAHNAESINYGNVGPIVSTAGR